MDYYKERRNAFKDIQEAIKDQGTLEVVFIQGVILRRYGFGKGMVKKFLDQLKEEGQITIEADSVKWIK